MLYGSLVCYINVHIDLARDQTAWKQWAVLKGNLKLL